MHTKRCASTLRVAVCVAIGKPSGENVGKTVQDVEKPGTQPPMTPAEARVYDAIVLFWEENKHAPTIADVAYMCERSRFAVHRLVTSLREKDFIAVLIVKGQIAPRSIRPNVENVAFANAIHELAVMLNEIPAPDRPKITETIRGLIMQFRVARASKEATQ